jgi:hypothetical protein
MVRGRTVATEFDMMLFFSCGGLAASPDLLLPPSDCAGF